MLHTSTSRANLSREIAIHSYSHVFCTLYVHKVHSLIEERLFHSSVCKWTKIKEKTKYLIDKKKPCRRKAYCRLGGPESGEMWGIGFSLVLVQLKWIMKTKNMWHFKSASINLSILCIAPSGRPVSIVAIKVAPHFIPHDPHKRSRLKTISHLLKAHNIHSCLVCI